MADPVWVFPFDSPIRSPDLLGGKGSSLARMAALGLPIPPGLTIGTPAWTAQRELGGELPPGLAEEIEAGLTALERQLDRRADDPQRPLLVSVRSGAPLSMPGMMDTVLNLGLSEPVVQALAERSGEAFAWDVYARLLETYAAVVIALPEDELHPIRAAATDTPSARERAYVWRSAMAARGAPFPEGFREQLAAAIRAVWRSWNEPRARRYRQFRGISDTLGTAVTVQAMVFGNLDDRSGTGVAFSRDPATGRPGV
jgi:pyruvate,orthophosphate dikinase